jgi:hypothetical protein
MANSKMLRKLVIRHARVIEQLHGSPRRLGTAAGPAQSRFSETARMLMTDARYQAVLRSVRSAILRISLSR